MTRALHIWVEGRVQGVYFRDSTRVKAAGLGLTGWVRNLSDGRVEALIVGEENNCRLMMDYVAVGPPGAMVTGLNHKWEDPPEKQFPGFEVRFQG